jgi:hypothetical protein
MGIEAKIKDVLEISIGSEAWGYINNLRDNKDILYSYILMMSQNIYLILAPPRPKG